MFGSTPAPAPPGGAFSLGGAPSPAPATGFSFGPKPAPAPTTGFGSSPAPPPAFGAAPPPAPTFGAAPPPAPTFGAAPPPVFGAAPPPGGLFGSKPATGGLFGTSPAPTPAGSLFGSSPTPAFGATTVASPVTPAVPAISAQTPFASLPPEAKRAIDALHEQVMRHKRTMMQVETMIPMLLRETKPADVAAGTAHPLAEQLKTIAEKLKDLDSKVQSCGMEAIALKQKFEESTMQSIKYGLWPLEALAARRGVKFSQTESKKSDPKVQEELRKYLDIQAAHVDRIEKIPSPYMWQHLEDMERRLFEIKNALFSLQHQFDLSRKISDAGVAAVVQSQSEALQHVALSVRHVHSYAEALRNKYRLWETKENVLDKADMEELAHRRILQEQVQLSFIRAAAEIKPPAAVAGTTPAPAAGGLFGATPAAAPKPGGLFGGSAPAPAGGLFGSTAPAPSTGGLFGSNAPAPAPLFGAAPAPAPTGGSTPAPAPAFGAAPAPAAAAPAPAGGSLFGAAPAAPAFGSTPAPAPGGGLFGAAPATNTVATPKTKNKSRNRRR